MKNGLSLLDYEQEKDILKITLSEDEELQVL